eukprot:gene14613-17280_t
MNGPSSNILNSSSSPAHSQASPSIEDIEEKNFISSLFCFMANRGTPIEKIPIFDHKELNLHKLYNCVISRGGLEAVIENKLWRQITTDLAVDPERTDAGFRLRIHYLKYLYPYERKYFLKMDDDEVFDYEAFEKHLSKSPSDKKQANSRKKNNNAITTTNITTTATTTSEQQQQQQAASILNTVYTPAYITTTTTTYPLSSSSSTSSSPITPATSITTTPSATSTSTFFSNAILNTSGQTQNPVVVNLKILEIKSLKKYNAIHRLKVSNSPSRKELVNAVIQHFGQQKIDEETIITSFLRRIKGENKHRLVEKV